MKNLRYLLLVFICGVLACQSQAMWWEKKPDSYPAILSEWTQSTQVYRGLNTIFTVSATYVHINTRRAYVRQYSIDHQLSVSEEKDLLTQEEAQAKSKHEFIVGVFSDEDEWTKLDSSNTIWDISFVNDKGLRVKPERIERLSEIPIYIKTYYPFITNWKKVYRISFPASSGNTPLLDNQIRRFSLEFLSAVAQVKLYWDNK